MDERYQPSEEDIKLVEETGIMFYDKPTIRKMATQIGNARRQEHDRWRAELEKHCSSIQILSCAGPVSLVEAFVKRLEARKEEHDKLLLKASAKLVKFTKLFIKANELCKVLGEVRRLLNDDSLEFPAAEIMKMTDQALSEYNKVAIELGNEVK